MRDPRSMKRSRQRTSIDHTPGVRSSISSGSSAGSAKGITALAWKAGLGMRVATQLQLRMGGIPPGDVLHARDGVDYPLTDEEMTWQLDFFQSFSG